MEKKIYLCQYINTNLERNITFQNSKSKLNTSGSKFFSLHATWKLHQKMLDLDPK